MTRRRLTDDEIIRTVISAVDSKHNTSAQALSYDLDVSVSTARKRLNHLVSQGLLRSVYEYRSGHGRHAERYRPTDAGLAYHTGDDYGPVQRVPMVPAPKDDDA